ASGASLAAQGDGAVNGEVQQLFHELADLSRDERERIFAERGIAPEIRTEVELLLDFDSPATDSLTASVARSAQMALVSSGIREFTHCGPYRLIRPLGSGGMGTVYLAERSDGEIQQRVAVKFIAAFGQRRGWRERFLKERQLLASLHHPSIVHVIDAGHAGEGLPYLVMEYVEGQPIDEYAEQLDLRSKLNL